MRVKGLFFHKIGTFAVLGSDNIIISMTPNLGIIAVGLYSNYNMIITALKSLFGQVFSSLTASIGNLLIENDRKKAYDVYKTTLMINSWIFAFSAISLYFISEPFINIWLGNEYVLSDAVVLILSINLYISGMRKTYETFKEAAGVFFEDRYVPIIESIVNIVGTIASNMVLFLFSFPKFVYKKILKADIKNYIKENVQYTLIFAIAFFATYLCINIFNIENNFIKIAVNAIICLIIPNSIYFILKFKSNEFKYLNILRKNIL